MLRLRHGGAYVLTAVLARVSHVYSEANETRSTFRCSRDAIGPAARVRRARTEQYNVSWRALYYYYNHCYYRPYDVCVSIRTNGATDKSHVPRRGVRSHTRRGT